MPAVKTDLEIFRSFHANSLQIKSTWLFGGRKFTPTPKQKEKERSKGHCLPHICQDKQKRTGGWWPVNLCTNEWALLKICHPLALHVVNIQPKPHRRLLFLLLSLLERERERKSKNTSYLLLSALNCPAIEPYSWLSDRRKDKFVWKSLMS